MPEAKVEVEELTDETSKKIERDVLLRALFDLNPDPVFCVARTGEITDVNAAAESLTGFGRDFILGTHFSAFYGADDIQRATKLVERVLAGESIHHENVRITVSEGKQFILDVTAFPALADGEVVGIVGIARDVTQRVRDIEELNRIRAALAKSESLLRDVTENIDQAFYLLSREGNQLLYLSSAFETIFGRSLGAGPDWRDRWLACLHPEDRLRHLRPSTVPFDLRYRIVRPDGSVRVIHDKGFPVAEDAGRVAGIVEDITERQELEGQLLQAQKMESIGRLAGGIAHDFNNLLMVVMNSADFLDDSLPPDHPAKSDVARVQEASRAGAALVRQILAYSRRQIVHPKVLDVNDAVEEMQTLFERTLGEDITLSVRNAPGLLQTRIDPTQLSQVLMNLVLNARDAMSQGGMLVISTANTVLTENSDRLQEGMTSGRYVAITVSDTGHGIEESVVGKIFEPFFSTKPMTEGTGLGLSTAYGIVTQAGGTISLHSEPRVGTTFRIYLPAVELEHAQSEMLVDERRSLSGAGRTVLVAEDELSVLAVTSRILTKNGYQVLHASSGQQALDLVKERDHPVDLLLTDVVMPVMSGRELASHMKVLRPSTRILYMSGYSEEMIGQHGVLQEDDNYIQKPFTSQELLAKIEAMLRS